MSEQPQFCGADAAVACTGGLAGMMGVVAGQPLDTLRIRLQQRTCSHSTISGVWRAMAGKEGLRALFKGMSYPLYTTSFQVKNGSRLRVLRRFRILRNCHLPACRMPSCQH